MRRQRLQGRPFEIQPFAVARIAAPDDLVDKAAIGFERVEITRAASYGMATGPFGIILWFLRLSDFRRQSY